jgi:hypothetical protein
VLVTTLLNKTKTKKEGAGQRSKEYEGRNGEEY